MSDLFKNQIIFEPEKYRRKLFQFGLLMSEPGQVIYDGCVDDVRVEHLKI